MGTYCKVEMKFTDVTALSDAEVSTEDNQSIGNVSNFKEQIAQADYGTLELNQFVLDASKRLLDEPEDIAFWNENLSKKDCSFEVNPKVSIHFTKQHSSSGLTFYFEDTYPAEMQVIWYTLDGIKLDAKTFYPDSLIFVCKHQVQNYGKIEIEFIRTTFPETYIKLQYILYGRYIVWDRDMIQTATVQEDIDLTSATLSINEADVSIVDVNNDFDVGNENGAWKSVQKNQEVTLSEYKDESVRPMGTFYINDFSFSGNISKFELVDSIGLMDKYTFYDGRIYENERAESILKTIFAAAGITKYVIAKEVGDVRLSGFLGIQKCREALQRVCFACGAVADDSRSDTIRVFYPDRYVSSEVGTNRKFNGGTIISLDEYVSGVSVEYTKYTLEQSASEIYKDVLPVGETKITFSDPYQPESIAVSVGEVLEVKTNYLIIDMANAGQCTITGRKYAGSTFSYQKNVERIEAGEVENIKSFTGSTLYSADLMQEHAERLLNYYALRKKVSMRYLVDLEQAGKWVNIHSMFGNIATSLVESQSIDLTGGFIGTATCRGYSALITDLYYAGQELYAGEDVII